MNNVLHHRLLLVFIFLTVACGDESCNVIPNVSVNQSFSQGSTNAGLGIGQSMALAGGVRGIIVYHSSSTGLVAYDRCSTVNPEERNQVVIKNAFTLHDPVSNAEWLMEDGSPTKIATCPLKPYRVSTKGNIYYVQN